MSTATQPGYGASLSLADARRIADAASQTALAKGMPSVIAVVDVGGHLVLQERLDDTQFGSIRVAEAKARSAVAFKRPTKVFEESLAHTPRILALDEAMPVDGGFPLIVGGEIVGGIGAAGATPDEGAEIALAGVNALTSAAAGKD
ncbi:GlcG/HbpS family heme-binding protein [Chelativorans alearense]|uniref:GlcG/HbpS family heme-binding protein n=1 Tax=Chelativorans alearense TaxID=2681495 RepID=UPI0013D0BE66|nr:heme-binding protein [Chelativorans alearense]